MEVFDDSNNLLRSRPTESFDEAVQQMQEEFEDERVQSVRVWRPNGFNPKVQWVKRNVKKMYDRPFSGRSYQMIYWEGGKWLPATRISVGFTIAIVIETLYEAAHPGDIKRIALEAETPEAMEKMRDLLRMFLAQNDLGLQIKEAGLTFTTFTNGVTILHES